MAIIVEVKSCCRNKKLDEGILDSLADVFTSDKGFAGEIRSRITEYLVEAIAEYLLGEISAAAKKTILYKTIVKSVSALDLKDYYALASGSGKAPVCEKLSAAVITGLLKVINNEIMDEINVFSRRFGGNNQFFNTIRDALAGSEKFIAGSMIEDLKNRGVLEGLSVQICEIDFAGLVKKQLGDIGSFAKGLNPFDE